MAIFKRNDQGDAQQATAAPAAAKASHTEPATKLMPPFVSAPKPVAAAGVVPPPAAPMYSMRPPETNTRVEADVVAEKTRTASDTQQLVQERVRVGVQAARTATSQARSVRRRPVQATPAMVSMAQARGRQSFDAVRAAQTGLLNLAWSWQEAGAPIRAIHAYMQVLHRYPDTPAADAAVADLVELSDKLAQKGQFHIALAIYDELEHLM